MLKVPNICLLPIPPRRLRNSIRVSAPHDDVGNIRAKSTPYDFELVSALILHRIVQQRCYCRVLAAAMLQHKARHTIEMRDIRNVRPFTGLLGVDF
jgi:hypothetical protein